MKESVSSLKVNWPVEASQWEEIPRLCNLICVTQRKCTCKHFLLCYLHALQFFFFSNHTFHRTNVYDICRMTNHYINKVARYSQYWHIFRRKAVTICNSIRVSLRAIIFSQAETRCLTVGLLLHLPIYLSFLKNSSILS